MSLVKKNMNKIQLGLKLKLTLWFMLIMAIVSSCLVGVVVGISENVVINEQEKELFNKVKACYDEMIQITECQTFIKGFKLGARFFIECFENDTDIFDE